MRQLILDVFPDSSGLVTIKGRNFRYLRQVLRIKNGDMVSLRLPDGILVQATAASVDDRGKNIIMQLCGDTADSPDTITRGVQAYQIERNGKRTEFWLMQFVPRPQKFELIVRQATECGIKRIIPVTGEYSEKGSISALRNSKKERLERIITEARQQSGSPVETEVTEPVTLEQAVGEWNSLAAGRNPAAFVLSERSDFCRPLHAVLKEKDRRPDLVCIAVGSEGGISPAEISFMMTKGLFMPVHFSVNILRCETAALYGTAAIQSAVEEADRMGDL